MTLPTKNQALIAIAIVLVAFASGRYSATSSQKPNVTINQQKQVDTQVKSDKDTHKTTTVTQKKEKDGTEETTTVVQEDTVTVVDKSQQATTNTKTVVTQPKVSKINVSILGAVDIRNPDKLVYGASVNKEFVGPVTLGVFGLANGIAGVSIGLNF